MTATLDMYAISMSVYCDARQSHTTHFAVASPQAYGAVAYLVHETHLAILMSKARTAPLKQHTLPRLELMAAVLGARLYIFISTSTNTTNTFFWSDSQIVLSWITSKKTLKPFVSNRINEIRSVSTEWRYCPSADNPADLLTRGITFDQFNSSTQWRHGPTWLSSTSKWPKWPHAEILLVQTEADEEVDIPAVDTIEPPSIGLHHLIDLKRFSKLSNYCLLLRMCTDLFPKSDSPIHHKLDCQQHVSLHKPT